METKVSPPNTTDTEGEGEEHIEAAFQDALVLKVCKTYHGNLTLLPAAKKTIFLRVCQTSVSRSTVGHMSFCSWWRSVIPIYIFCQEAAGMICFIKQNKKGRKVRGTWRVPAATDSQIGQLMYYLMAVQLRRLQLHSTLPEPKKQWAHFWGSIWRTTWYIFRH